MHLNQLVDVAKEYTHVFVIVGDNDVQNRSISYICNKFLQFKNDIWSTRVKFCGNLHRRDLDANVVAQNNVFLSEKLGILYKSPKIIKREEFHHIETYHLDRFGYGYRHMAALILSVLEEFVLEW